MGEKIKTRKIINSIKGIDKASNTAGHMKDTFIRTQEKVAETQQPMNESPNEYATDTVYNETESGVNSAANHFKHVGRSSAKKVYDGYKVQRQVRQTQKAESNTIKTPLTNKTIKQSEKAAGKTIKTSAKGSVKTAIKSVKTAGKTVKATIKTTQQTVKAAAKTAEAAAKSAKAAVQTVRVTAKTAVTSIKAVAKAIVASGKAIIAAAKGIVEIIAAGGWIAVVIILVICMVALLAGSSYGIFFADEVSGAGGLTMKKAITSINEEYYAKIDEICISVPHDSVLFNDSDKMPEVTNWNEVLIVYAVKATTDPQNPTEVVTLDEKKIELLRMVFWDMNIITYGTETIEQEEIITTIDEDGNEVSKTITTTDIILSINVTVISFSEIAEEYGFDAEQKEQLGELMKLEYQALFLKLTE